MEITKTFSAKQLQALWTCFKKIGDFPMPLALFAQNVDFCEKKKIIKTTGATLAFLVSRFLLRDWVQAKFGNKLQAINDGIEKEGAFYLFTLRLVPAFPFFIINLVMSLTPIKTLQFYLVSQLGMLAGTLVYVNAGTQMSKINSLSEILSPGLLISFILLGVFLLLAKKGLKLIKRRTS